MHARRRMNTIAAAGRLLLAGLAVSLSFSGPRSEPREAPPWNQAGRRVALATLERGSARPLPGRYSWLCSSMDVRALAIDGDTLWIGTEGGLFAMSLALDVVEPVAGPASASIRALATGQGALWVGGDHSVSSRSEGRWRHYAPDTNPLFRQVRCFGAGEGRIWIGSFGAGMGYVAGDAATFVSSAEAGVDRRVLAIAEQSPETIYFGTASGLMIADTSGWKSLRYGSRLPLGPVESLAFDEEGDLFCSIPGEGVAIYSFGRVRAFGPGTGTPGANVRAFSLDPSTRRMWAAGADGVFVYDGTEWAEQELRGLEGHKRRFLSMRHDAEGTCYLGTDTGTVVVVSRGAAREIRVPQAFSERRTARLRSAGGAVWCIAGAGVFVNRGSFAPAARPPELYAEEMTDLLPLDAGDLWLATRFGILRASGKTWEIFDRRNGLATEHFVRAARDPGGTLWFASADKGVVSYRSGAWTAYTRENGLPANEISDLIVDGFGTPWIATRSGEVARFSDGTWERVPLRMPAGASAAPAAGADSLGYDPAIRFLPDVGRGAGNAPAQGGDRLGLDRAGSCLVATGAGVFRLGADGFVLTEFPGPLRGLRPTAVLGSSRGELWVGTAGDGILVHRGTEWIRLTAANGLSDDYVRSLCEDSGGVLWIGTQAGGMTRYAPAGGR